ncbi:MAG: hypothetical protein Q7K43_02495 [Candidatus Woesearchaeota archaeon]|nr:hypothetical protein [Candidatus Woesearchaeota archaeon]
MSRQQQDGFPWGYYDEPPTHQEKGVYPEARTPYNPFTPEQETFLNTILAYFLAKGVTKYWLHAQLTARGQANIASVRLIATENIDAVIKGLESAPEPLKGITVVLDNEKTSPTETVYVLEQNSMHAECRVTRA